MKRRGSGSNNRLMALAVIIVGLAIFETWFVGVHLAAQKATPPNTAHLNITIVSDTMTGKPGFPTYVPSDFTLPANSTIDVRVVNFDSAAAPPRSYASARGLIVDRFSVAPIKIPAPNSPGPAQSMSSIDPSRIGHTFTVPSLGINVPLAAHAVTTFSFRTRGPGTYAWHCFAPCGSGPTGWGGAMAASSGFMEGVLHVVPPSVQHFASAAAPPLATACFLPRN